MEQALLAADQTQRSELRRKLAQLTKLATQNPGEVERVMQDIERRRKRAERWKGNQNLGKAVEHTAIRTAGVAAGTALLLGLRPGRYSALHLGQNMTGIVYQTRFPLPIH